MQRLEDLELTLEREIRRNDDVRGAPGGAILPFRFKMYGIIFTLVSFIFPLEHLFAFPIYSPSTSSHSYLVTIVSFYLPVATSIAISLLLI